MYQGLPTPAVIDALASSPGAAVESLYAPKGVQRAIHDHPRSRHYAGGLVLAAELVAICLTSSS